jgi:hypothetical protein
MIKTSPCRRDDKGLYYLSSGNLMNIQNDYSILPCEQTPLMIIKYTINRLSRGENPPAKRRRLDNGEVISSPTSIPHIHPFEIRTLMLRLTSMICTIQNLRTESSWRCKNDSATLKAVWRKIKLRNLYLRMYAA